MLNSAFRARLAARFAPENTGLKRIGAAVIRPYAHLAPGAQGDNLSDMTGDPSILNHTSGTDLAGKILAALGKTAPTPDDLAPVDEMHIGGRAATAHLMTYLQFRPGMRVLDIGSGLGGTARFIAQATGAHVTGIDVNPAWCAAATTLTARTGLSQHIIYRQGNATAMPFAHEEFDGACSLHTAMNVADKAVLYQEIARILRPGALFGLYDVLRGTAVGEPAFPLPWADDAGNSFLATPDDMRRLLTAAGFEILVEDDLSGFGLLSLKKLQQADPAFGPRLMMGEAYPQKIANLVQAIADKRCAPWLMICRKKDWRSAP